MNKMKGIGRVFSFTFRQQTRTGGWRGLTVTLALLCFLVPAIVLGVMALRADSLHAGYYNSAPAPEPQRIFPQSAVSAMLFTDETDDPITDWSFLQPLHPESWGDVIYADAADTAADEHAVFVTLRHDGVRYEAQMSLPEDSALTDEDVAACETYLWGVLPTILEVKSGLTPDQLAILYGGVDVTMPDAPEAPQTDPTAGAKELLGMLLPYLCVMVMYFLVLFYGQGVANSVILEKTSKLMDFFLVSVEPAAMVLGKVLAIAAAGLLQLGLWLLSLAGGFAVGAALCRSIAPQAQFGILTFFESLSLFEGMFSLPAIALAVGIVLGGFLLYCALAGVGGALAGKAEDLSSTNVLFSLTLVASFLICLLGGSGDAMISAAAWLNFVPFTAILVTPARVLLGEVSLGVGALSFVIVLASAAVVCLLAGKVYRMMSLYKGNPPSLRQMFTMLKEDK
ncbi:MAG: hypothetical protein E7469_07910 [Ruminococcaceae bacterium]|nr:hypothetical protein [Oscillospiraceae bacterium]